MTMVIRLKSALIEQIEDTETRNLKHLRIVATEDGASLMVELPIALCEGLAPNQTVDVVIDGGPIPKGEQSKVYLRGSVFKYAEKKGLHVVGSMGGLRLVLNLPKVTPVRRKTFENGIFYVRIN